MRIFLIIYFAFSLTPSFGADAPFTDELWSVQGVEHKRTTYLGRDALFLRNANAVLKDVAFYNGVIEVDVAVNGKRGFSSIRWRRQPDFSGENFLIRNHKPGERDSAQYEAFHGGRSSWQLYNRDGYTTHVTFPTDDWFTIKIVVNDRAADIYVNSDEPVLHVSALRGADLAGILQINAANAGAYFSNFRYRLEDDPELIGATMNLPRPPAPDGAIRHWELSNLFADGAFGDAMTLPKKLGVDTWTSVQTDQAGLINLSEHLPVPSFNRQDDDMTTAVAKTKLTADKARRVRMVFGFSDYLWVYLNGERLYYGENRFREEDRRLQGLVTRLDEIVLDLQKGDNELVFVLQEDDRFGWGFLTEIRDLDGLQLP